MHVQGQKLYAVVDLIGEAVVGWTSFSFGYDDETGSEQEPEFNLADHELVLVTKEDLSGGTVDEFLAGVHPVIVAGAFSSWEANPE